MKNHNRRRKIGKLGRLRWLRTAQVESLEDRRLLDGDGVEFDYEAWKAEHEANQISDIVIGVGNLPRRDTLITAEITIDEIDEEPNTNDSLDTAQRLPLGFDLGEFEAIDIRGELNDVTVTAQPNKEATPVDPNNPLPPEDRDDSSFDNANQASSNGITRFTGFLGDSPLGNNGGNPFLVGGDGDYYRLTDIEAGQFVTANVADNGVTGASFGTALILYDEFGRIIQSSEANPTVPNFISHQILEDGTYYFGVFPYFDVSIFTAPQDPTNPDKVFGGPPEEYEITISVDGAADIDVYAVDLMPGDIIGANGIGSADVISLRNPNGDLLLQSGEDRSDLYPLESPLPGGGNTSLAYVIDEPGTYYLGVQGNRTYNNYLLEARVFRPAIESEPEGSEQILFLDFDGATFSSQIVFGPVQRAELSPMRDFLPALGIRDEALLIDKIVAEVKRDYDDLKAFNPDMKLTILNSKDHADPFGQPNVSRIIVGGTQVELGFPPFGLLGIAESIDLGNFDRTETAITLMDIFSGPPEVWGEASLNHYVIAPGAEKIDLVARGISTTVSHEAAHFFGAWHTEGFNSTVNLIDGGGGNIWEEFGVGPDRIWGTADDVDSGFVNDTFSLSEGYVGVNNVPGMFANIFVAGQGTDGQSTPQATGSVFRDENGDGVQDTGEGGFGGIRVYADVNGDDQFGISEPTAITANDGTFVLAVDASDETVAIRVATQSGQSVTAPTSGEITVGEVIQGVPVVFGVQSLAGDASGTDFGHAPVSYGSASHDIQAGVRLGSSITGDDASGEDTNDDGVTISGLSVGGTATATITAVADGFAPGLINGWIDFDDDGRFEPNERVVSNVQVNGTESISFPVPSTATPGETWARFRIGYVRNIGPNGTSSVGEVEDYVVTIASAGGGTGGGGGGGGGGDQGPQANPDVVEVDAGAQNLTLNVLANDDAGTGAVVIQQVSASTVGSTIQVSTDGQRILYTPAAGLTGSEVFSYTIGNDFDTSTTTVTVNINSDAVDPGGNLVEVRLVATDTSGTPISTIGVGQDFNVSVFVDDLRAEASREGVFAAYLDVEFDSTIADFAGDIVFGEYFVNQQNPLEGVLANLPGPEDNDLGGFGQDRPTETTNQLLMTIPMVANSQGVFEVTTNGPDNLPFRDILLYPISSPEVTDDRVVFGSTTLTVTSSAVAAASPFTNQINRFDVDADGHVVPRDALVLISNINEFGARQLNPLVGAVSGPYLDVTGDGWLSPRDARDLIAEINRLSEIANASASGEPDDGFFAAAIDAALQEDDEEFDPFG